MNNVITTKKVLNATVARNKDLFNTVSLLDQKLDECREIANDVDTRIIEKYHEVGVIVRDLMETDNLVIAYPLNSELGTVWLIEINVDETDNAVYQPVGYEIDDKTNMLTSINLVALT